MFKRIHNILILHGWQSKPEHHWFLKAKENFEKKGYKVFVPKMPGGYFPKKEEWLEIIKSYNPDESWVLIGHSLGGVAILRYLESAQKPVGKVILISTPFHQMDFEALNGFFNKEIDLEKLKSKVQKIELIYEKDDPVVPFDHGKRYAEKFGCDLCAIDGYLHMHEIDLKLLEKMIEE